MEEFRMLKEGLYKYNLFPTIGKGHQVFLNDVATTIFNSIVSAYFTVSLAAFTDIK
jgi:hypothetical protein